MADISKSGNKALIMTFSHGDYDSVSGLCIGIIVTSTFEDDRLLKLSQMASIFLKYPDVKTTIYMTSYYSGHWVETTEFQGRDLKPVVLTAVERKTRSAPPGLTFLLKFLCQTKMPPESIAS